jgi:hypothetical protein
MRMIGIPIDDVKIRFRNVARMTHFVTHFAAIGRHDLTIPPAARERFVQIGRRGTPHET